MQEQEIRKQVAGMLAPIGLKAFKTDDGKWQIRNKAGQVVAGASELQTLLYTAQVIAGDPHPERFQSQEASRSDLYQAGRKMARKLSAQDEM